MVTLFFFVLVTVADFELFGVRGLIFRLSFFGFWLLRLEMQCEPANKTRNVKQTGDVGPADLGLKELLRF